MQDLVIIGAGGHAKTVIEIAECSGSYKILCLVDKLREGENIFDYPIRSDIAALPVCNFVVAIGDNKIRAQEFLRLCNLNWRPVNLIHPQSIVSKRCQMGEGNTIAPGVILNAGAVIGSNCIINTGSMIDHDCTIESHVHVGPGCHLAGSIHVGEGAFLGIGSVVLPKIRIGAWSNSGGGSVIIDTLQDHDTVAGVPAKSLLTKSTV